MLGTTPNPWPWSVDDPRNPGQRISISIPWNSSTRALQNSTVTRDAGCTLGTLEIIDPGPPRVEKTFPVPVGSSTITANRFGQNGLNTIDDVLGLSITAAA